MRLRVLSVACIFAMALLLAGGGVAAAGTEDGAVLKYSVKAKVSVLGESQALGTWPVEGDLSVTFSPPGEDGRREITFVLDRLDAPDLPGFDGVAAVVGKPLVLVVDARGQVVGFDLPLPEDVKNQFQAALAAAQPKTPETLATGLPAVGFIEGLKRMRPGTTFAFSYAAPREAEGAKDELRLQIEFPGPNPEETAYAINGNLSFDFAIPKGQQVNGTLLTQTEFGAEEGLLQLLDLELVAKLAQEAPAALEFGVKLTLALDEVLPYED